MAIPSQPPTPDFKWPAKWEDWQWDLIEWVKARQPYPDPADFDVSETPGGVFFSIADQAIAQAIATANLTRLSVVDASVGGTPRVRVYLGYVGGVIADPGMTDPGDSPAFKVTLPSTLGYYYICADLVLAYDDSSYGQWSVTSSAVADHVTVPAATATTSSVKIALVKVISASGGGYEVSIDPVTGQIASGDQFFARMGGASSLNDSNGTQLGA